MKAVNLLPADLRGGLKSPAPVAAAGEPAGGSGAYVVLGALALCVVALAGYVLTTNTIKQRQADVAALEARNAALMAESARLKPYADFQSMAQARVATVRDLATRRFDWEQSFRDLARAVPQDVTVTKLGATISSQTGGAGAASSPLRAALDVPAIQVDGCAPGQQAVARMMARLRGVEGVTRVSLQNSTKPEKSDAVVDAAPGARPAGCDMTGGATPPDFTVLAFFEEAKAASADAATAATGATATATASGTQASTAGGTTASTTTDGAK
ncbi:MAG TPA: PilN domain-containing protein [Solirubrobacteraceae bacterium]|nr:PilN domain-containing protein [Solirubrobacteraceae bacterium]